MLCNLGSYLIIIVMYTLLISAVTIIEIDIAMYHGNRIGSRSIPDQSTLEKVRS